MTGPKSAPPGRCWALLVLAVLVLSACTSGDEQEPVAPAEGTPSEELFSPDSPWRLPVPEDPVIDAGSDEMVAALTEDGGAIALIEEYGVPVYEAGPDTPQVEVRCTEDWGPCQLEEQLVPVPEDARPSEGSDGAMVVLDREAGRIYDFWQAEPDPDGGWTTSWGTWAPIGGDGTGEAGGATGAGINLLAGLVRISELEAGRIDHALAVVSDNSCPEAFRYPATKTDGHADDHPCIPQGARIQLDPSIDVESIEGITPGEVAVAKALQTHGAYLRDSSQAAMGIAFETPTGEDNPYPEVAGFTWDYYSMSRIPWDRLRVLDGWDGRGSP